ncbi:unnamed protein product [Arabis nemorensis]|uniref:NYN domain-containing protein n=1 Tax=Arabis nemorensis TaxID=586526 RepID=A0A565BIY1_9BRAS|nr:unnamed protein product [Arabis nemorensis]
MAQPSILYKESYSVQRSLEKLLGYTIPLYCLDQPILRCLCIFPFAGIGAFWLLDEQIIPEGLGPCRIYRNIEEALDNLASWTYRETSFKMMVDMLFYALNNPALNLMVIQNAMTKVLASVLKAFKSRNYNVLIAGPSFEVVQGFCVELGMPILQCGSMQRVRDTSVDRGRPNGIYAGWHMYLMGCRGLPDGLCPDLIFETIGSALAKKDYRGDVLILAYGEKQTFPDELPDSRIRSSFVPDGEEPERSFTMLLDMLFWALDNPVEHMEPPSLMRLRTLHIREPVQLRSGKLLTTESPIWLWTSLLDAAKPIDQSGSSQSVGNKRKREAEYED